ncbi:hypothetical protein NSTC745_05683 [Nostoc sp. DSM 114161]|jgi:hypothetical protein|uniref:hypothetical protein n=1 Tax=Nostoc sp. DSM 114161 TaxID=3440143 RepID=UPI004045C309
MNTIIQVFFWIISLCIIIPRFWLLLTLGSYVVVGMYITSIENTWQWFLGYIIIIAVGFRVIYLRSEDIGNLSVTEALKATISMLPYITILVFYSKCYVDYSSKINTLEYPILACIYIVTLAKLMWYSWEQIYKKYPKSIEKIRSFNQFPYKDEINTKSSVFWSITLGGYCLGYAICIFFPKIQESIVSLISIANEVAASHWLSQLG